MRVSGLSVLAAIVALLCAGVVNAQIPVHWYVEDFPHPQHGVDSRARISDPFEIVGIAQVPCQQVQAFLTAAEPGRFTTRPACADESSTTNLFILATWQRLVEIDGDVFGPDTRFGNFAPAFDTQAGRSTTALLAVWHNDPERLDDFFSAPGLTHLGRFQWELALVEDEISFEVEVTDADGFELKMEVVAPNLPGPLTGLASPSRVTVVGDGPGGTHVTQCQSARRRQLGPADGVAFDLVGSKVELPLGNEIFEIDVLGEFALLRRQSSNTVTFEGDPGCLP